MFFKRSSFTKVEEDFYFSKKKIKEENRSDSIEETFLQKDMEQFRDKSLRNLFCGGLF